MRRVALLVTIALVMFCGLTALELLDEEGPSSWGELAADMVEILLLVGAFVAVTLVAIETRALREENNTLISNLNRSQQEGEQWRNAVRQHLDGINSAISDQFQIWQLSKSEADIAVLLLKGFSHKEIANLRETAVATVRRQSQSIYRKSGLANRAELAAFFLEDLVPNIDSLELDEDVKFPPGNDAKLS